MTVRPPSLIDYQLALVRTTAIGVPYNLRDRYLSAVFDKLGTVTNNEILGTTALVLSQLIERHAQ